MDDPTMPACPFAIQYRGSQPMREIVVDQNTARRLEELCSEMTDTCGLIEATLQLAVEDKSEKNSGRSAKDSTIGEPELAPIPNSVTAHSLTAANEPTHLAEMEQRAVVNAMRETGGDKLAASRLLGIGRTTLYRKLKGYHQSS